MKISIGISFRVYANAVRAILPPDLAFIGDALKNSIGYFTSSKATVEVDPAIRDRVMAWAQQDENAKTLIEYVGIHEDYELSDLQGQEVVEIVEAPEVDETCNVRNYEANGVSAFDLLPDCTYCQRKVSPQQDDLLIVAISAEEGEDGERFDDDFTSLDDDDPERASNKAALTAYLTLPFDFQTDSSYRAWIVSERVRAVLEKYGVTCRPLKNSQDYWQMVADRVVLVTAPLVSEFPCPVCQRPLFLYRDSAVTPFTLSGISRSFLGVAKNDVAFGWYDPDPTPEEYASARENADPSRRRRGPASWYFFANAGMVRELLEFGATGLAFRPVNIVSE